MAKSLTLFFIVEPPSYQHKACYLAARQPRDTTYSGYVEPDIRLVPDRRRVGLPSYSSGVVASPERRGANGARFTVCPRGLQSWSEGVRFT